MCKQRYKNRFFISILIMFSWSMTAVSVLDVYSFFILSSVEKYNIAFTYTNIAAL